MGPELDGSRFLDDGVFSLEITEGFGSRATELGIWASAPFQGALSFFAKREEAGYGPGRGELTGSFLFIARIRGHAALGAGMAPMPGLANQSQGDVSQVLHVSRCPNVNPQGWPLGSGQDAQHSLLSPSRPSGGCQVLAGTGVAGVAGERKEEGKKGLSGGSW